MELINKNMSYEKYLHLFTRVEDGLPKESGKYICLYKNGFIRSSNYSTLFEFMWKHENVIAWLDLSKLTAKKKAIELAADAYNTGWNDYHEVEQGGSESTFENFINENKERL